MQSSQQVCRLGGVATKASCGFPVCCETDHGRAQRRALQACVVAGAVRLSDALATAGDDSLIVFGCDDDGTYVVVPLSCADASFCAEVVYVWAPDNGTPRGVYVRTVAGVYVERTA